MAKAIEDTLANREMSPEQAAYVRANPQVIAASPMRKTLENLAGVEAQPRIAPKLREEYAQKHEEPAQEEPAHEEPETQIIQMIPRDTSLSGFRQSIIESLIREAKVSTDPAVKKLADVLALIDEYEGERSGERRNESQVA